MLINLARNGRPLRIRSTFQKEGPMFRCWLENEGTGDQSAVIIASSNRQIVSTRPHCAAFLTMIGSTACRGCEKMPGKGQLHKGRRSASITSIRCKCSIALSLKEANSVMVAELCNPFSSVVSSGRLWPLIDTTAICGGTLEVEYLNFYR